MLLFVDFANRLLRRRVVDPARPKRLFKILQHGLADLVPALCGKLLHPAPDQCRILRLMVEQTLKIARNQDVHGRRDRLVKIALLVINARLQEIRQYVVAVRRTDQFRDGKPHALGIITRENIAEIARRHAEVDELARCNRPLFQEFGIGAEVVDDLRHEPAPVDRICRRQLDVPSGKLLSKGLVAENLLDAVLRIVKIPLDRDDTDICALLRAHLQVLDLRHAARRIEHEDLDLIDIGKTFERRLARVARRGNENQNLSVLTRLLERRLQKLRQKLQCHVLERTRRPVPELQYGEFLERVHGRDAHVVKLAAPVSACNAACKLL